MQNAADTSRRRSLGKALGRARENGQDRGRRSPALVAPMATPPPPIFLKKGGSSSTHAEAGPGPGPPS
jgi:hypothetical protein